MGNLQSGKSFEAIDAAGGVTHTVLRLCVCTGLALLVVMVLCLCVFVMWTLSL